MLARMHNTLRMMGRQFHDLRNDGGLKLIPDERAELTWAKVIEWYDKVPEVYREFFDSHLSKGQVFPYIVSTPAFETLGCRISAKLVCAIEDKIYVLEKSGNTFTAQCYPLDAISYVEVSSMLLDLRIKISGTTKEGILTSSILWSSSATDYLFTPILKMIRLHTVGSKDTVRNSDLERFDLWIELNFKFMNLARHSVLGGEKVIHAILQLEIRASLFKILGRTFYRTTSPTHACILTDRELILIHEEALQGRKDKYGRIWEYIPLNKIAALSMSRKEDNLLALSIQLVTDEHFECLFEASMKDEVDQLIHGYRKKNEGINYAIIS